MMRWVRSDLIALDEVGKVPLSDIGAVLIVTTSQPFSELTRVFPICLCKALFDLVTDLAHIIETGTEFVSVQENDGREEEVGAASLHRNGRSRRPFRLKRAALSGVASLRVRGSGHWQF